VVALLERLRVEERGQSRERVVVVVDGDGEVLLRGRELVSDLLVEALDKGWCGHAAQLYLDTRRRGVRFP
jgi:hypothetical protein